MRQEISETIDIPEGIEVDISPDRVVAKKGTKKIELRFKRINIEKEGNVIKLFNKKGNKEDKRYIKTMLAHLKNIFQGFNEAFVYKLHIASVHFPMNVTYDSSKRELSVKNFLGEKNARVAKIKDDVDVKVEKEVITLVSHNKEAAGQSAANIEYATKIRNRDRRVFQDGIFIVSKSGRAL